MRPWTKAAKQQGPNCVPPPPPPNAPWKGEKGRYISGRLSERLSFYSFFKEKKERIPVVNKKWTLSILCQTLLLSKLRPRRFDSLPFLLWRQKSLLRRHPEIALRKKALIGLSSYLVRLGFSGYDDMMKAEHSTDLWYVPSLPIFSRSHCYLFWRSLEAEKFPPRFSSSFSFVLRLSSEADAHILARALLASKMCRKCCQSTEFADKESDSCSIRRVFSFRSVDSTVWNLETHSALICFVGVFCVLVLPWCKLSFVGPRGREIWISIARARANENFSSSRPFAFYWAIRGTRPFPRNCLELILCSPFEVLA